MKRPEEMTRQELEDEVTFLRGEMGMLVEVEDIRAVQDRWGASPHEARTLLALHRAKGRCVSRDMLSETVPERYGDRLRFPADIYVSRLRARMGKGAIETIWGRGYAITPYGAAQVESVLLTHRRAA